MKTKRSAPYIWTTWATGHLSGEKHCYYSSWKRSQYQNLDTLPNNFDQAAWIMAHTEMLTNKKCQLENEGWLVTIEDQNKFLIQGSSGGKLSGKADIVAVKNNIVKVIDCKTGKPKIADVAQVQIYMFALSRLNKYKGLKMFGEVIYGDHHLPVPGESVDTNFKMRLFNTLATLTSANEPNKTPSYSECQYCPLSLIECPDRINEETSNVVEGSFQF